MDARTVVLFLAMLTVAANVSVIAVALLAVASRGSRPAALAFGRLRDAATESGLSFAWVVATVSTLGSLYYSELAHFVPCKLCWYQRIAMYPLVVVLAIAVRLGDVDVRRYVLPVVGIGALIASYHYQLERFPKQASVGCSAEAPCTALWVWQFHYVSIPFEALSAFALIAAVLLLARRTASPDDSSEPARTAVTGGPTP